MYLIDIVLLWWRHKCDYEKHGSVAIDTWKTFQTMFRQQFYLKYAKDKAQVKLRKLAQNGEVREYVREFSKLMFHIFYFKEKEVLFFFMDGLKPWAKQEL